MTHAHSNTRHQTSSFGRFSVVAAFALALAGSTLLVLRSSEAVFTDTTQNTGNSFAAGTIDLVDDDAAAARFTVSAMKPGDTSTGCITVTYQGTITNPTAVKLYSGGYTDSGNFADYLKLTVEEGAGGSFGSCVGFAASNTIVNAMTLATFNTTHTNYATGAGVWDPASTPVSKTYRFTVELDATTPNAEQGEQVTGLSFVWEVQSN